MQSALRAEFACVECVACSHVSAHVSVMRCDGLQQCASVSGAYDCRDWQDRVLNLHARRVPRRNDQRVLACIAHKKQTADGASIRMLRVRGDSFR